MLVFLTAGIVTGLSAGASPGPLLALVISQSVRHGAREGIKVALVPLLSDLPIVLASLLFLSRLGSRGPVLGALSLAGALVLIHLALDSFRAGPPGAAAGDEEPRSIRKGLLVNLLSPHPYLFWIAVGAPTMLRGWAQGPWGAPAFLGGFYACLVGSKVAVAVAADRSRALLGGRGYVRLMRALGGLLALLALVLLRDGLSLLGLL